MARVCCHGLLLRSTWKGRLARDFVSTLISVGIKEGVVPIYEFWCRLCDRGFEALRQVSSAPDPAPCPHCAHLAMRQISSPFSAFTQRGGYPRGLPDKGQAYGPIDSYTTYATAEQKAKAAKEKKRRESE